MIRFNFRPMQGNTCLCGRDSICVTRKKTPFYLDEAQKLPSHPSRFAWSSFVGLCLQAKVFVPVPFSAWGPLP